MRKGTGHLHDDVILRQDQDQNAVSSLYCETNFSNCLFISKREDKFEPESILTKHSGLGSKITPSCKWLIEENHQNTTIAIETALVFKAALRQQPALGAYSDSSVRH